MLSSCESRRYLSRRAALAGIVPLGIRPRDALHLAFAPQVGFKFGSTSRKHLPAAVEVSIGYSIANATLAEIMDDACRSRKDPASLSIRVDNQSIALAEKLKERRQLFAAIGAGAGHLLGPHYGAAGGGEGIELDGEVLTKRRKRERTLKHSPTPKMPQNSTP